MPFAPRARAFRPVAGRAPHGRGGHLPPSAANAARARGLAVAVVAALAGAPRAYADVYKCAGDNGVPVYQEMPCEAGKELRNFQLDPPEITVIPAPSRSGSATGSPPPRDARAADAKAAGAAKNGNGARAGSAAPPPDASERKHIRLGMTEAEVVARIGRPDVTVGSRGSTTLRWTYMPAPGDADTTTALVLTKGVVTDIERKVLRK